MLSLFIIITFAVLTGMLLSCLVIAALAMNPVFLNWYTKKVVECSMKVYNEYEDESMKD